MSAESVSTREIGGFRRLREGGHAVDMAIAELARRQHGVVSRAQLKELGLLDDAIEHRLGAGRLHRLHPGVYAVGHRRLSTEGVWMAAVLASGPESVLSHHSAAELWGLRSYSEHAVEVIVPRKSTSSKEIRRHRSILPADEVAIREGIRVTSVPRTILDLAAKEPDAVVTALIRRSEYLRLHDRLSLPELVDRYPGRRGVRCLRVALARVSDLPPGHIRSRLEERFVAFLEAQRLPQPRFNDWIVVGERRFQVDCHWPGTGQIVELDGWEAHGSRSAFREDRARDRILRVAGYAVTRVTWAQLEDEPDAIAADLRALFSDEAA